jgi:signal transduction histidine kinase
MNSAHAKVRVFAAAVLLAVLMLGGAGQTAAVCESASLEEAKAMAERAAALLERQGPDRTLTTFMDPAGDFIDRDLYVFVIDLRGTVWVNGGFPGTVGTNALGTRDSRGRLFVQEMMRIALEAGHGWVEYEWLNPCTGKVNPKASYVIRVGPFIVGVGAYGTVAA